MLVFQFPCMIDKICGFLGTSRTPNCKAVEFFTKQTALVRRVDRLSMMKDLGVPDKMINTANYGQSVQRQRVVNH